MSAPKFTPGPWHCQSDGHVYSGDGYAIHDHPDYSSIRDMDVIAANGCLIAAAPLLYEALRVAYADLQQCPVAPIGTLGRIEAALAAVEAQS